ncbi:LapA family protein [Mesorhizobium sp. ZC-5]|uniref:LapA family protein n=1 Tax=Mesorhizobium sp. ZC-5 TaxID=2986066 RepID=UPI0021E6E82D|nr:LapA family protein [Mesorhizobium sp. ZC-5]MCV3239567.1 LapA family protein [Mesorhizobium sp. ZC-5]
MYNRFLLIVVFVPLAVVLIALAVANRGLAAFTLDPFNPGNPALTLQLPLFVLLFAALAIGLIVGSIATWLKQGRYRKLARQRGQEAQILRDSVQQDASRAAAQSQALTRQNA